MEGDVHVLQIDLERDSSDGPYTLTISVTAAVSIDVFGYISNGSLLYFAKQIFSKVSI